jgi:uncharacterized protein YjeT (DUF2065 family)
MADLVLPLRNLLFAGGVCVVIIVTISIALEQATFLSGSLRLAAFCWGFVLAGLGLILPPLLAAATWRRSVGTIDRVADDPEIQRVGFHYAVNGIAYRGQVNETGNKKIGGSIAIFIHPTRPEKYLANTMVPRIIGVCFVVLGTACALNL